MQNWIGAELTGKSILIISPQSWGKMFVSKHHYAIELAKRGNKVFFLNPPEEKVSRIGRTAVELSNLSDNLMLISHTLWFPYRIKFHALPLFHWLMKFHVQKLLRKTGVIDVVWSFDLGNLYPFRLWGNNVYRIFHPVDEPLNTTAINSAQKADVIFSVTHEILGKYKAFPAPKHFINHGLSEDFLQWQHPNYELSKSVRVGFAGNLLRGDIDREVFLQIVRNNPTVIFECWGSYTSAQSNIGGGENEATQLFISALTQLENVVLHGPVPSGDLAKAMQNMDAFLICYDVQKDQSKGTNYHKVIEYLSTGKVIISNNITTYQQYPGLVEMIADRENNLNLPGLFSEVINNLQRYNSAANQNLRVSFARDNTYKRQIERIETLLNAK